MPARQRKTESQSCRLWLSQRQAVFSLQCVPPESWNMTLYGEVYNGELPRGRWQVVSLPKQGRDWSRPALSNEIRRAVHTIKTPAGIAPLFREPFQQGFILASKADSKRTEPPRADRKSDPAASGFGFGRGLLRGSRAGTICGRGSRLHGISGIIQFNDVRRDVNTLRRVINRNLASVDDQREPVC